MSKFYDAIDVRHYPHGQPAAFYGDGRFAATGSDIASVGAPEYRLITVTGNGRLCSIIDGRPDNNINDTAVRGFVRERRAMHAAAIIYTPRSFVVEYQRALFDLGRGDLDSYGGLFWWIATLDGHDWTAQELAQDISDHWDAMVPADRIWAVQNNQLPEIGPGALADESTLFLPWRPI
jgi:hypothetical protein